MLHVKSNLPFHIKMDGKFMGYGLVDVLIGGGVTYAGINMANWSTTASVLSAIAVVEVYHVLTDQRDVLIDTFMPTAVSGSGCGCSSGKA